jgi:DNA-binding FadR family transcriptional regulator
MTKNSTKTWVRRPANLARALTAELVGRIVRGLHQPGTPLPPEPALCETFSVSRTVVREAVKLLQEKGLVQVRRGSGTIVTPPTTWNMLDELVLAATIAEDETLAILDDLVVTRRLLESAAHDPYGAAEAMFNHITDAWLVRRGGPGDALRLQR